MFDIDNWQEIYDTVRKNKLRTFLTGFSVAWGIFMLIILLGAGIGLENGILYQFSSSSKSAIWINPSVTTMPYQGNKAGKWVDFTNTDYDFLKTNTPKLEYVSSRFMTHYNMLISYKNETGNYDLRNVHPQYAPIEHLTITEGRFINELDIKDNRKVVVISNFVKDNLLKNDTAVGNYIKINHISFRIIGCYTDEDNFESNNKGIYVPISTAQKIFMGSNNVSTLVVTTKASSVEESKSIEKEIKLGLFKKHRIAPEDESAIGTWNAQENLKNQYDTIRGINIFVWIIGILTILAGIVGVSNIMIISVKERSKEIGIRKALGATSTSIIRLILSEALVITAFSGYVGLVLGSLLLEAIAPLTKDFPFFRNPEVNISIALWATLVLVIAGLIAGYIPARNAAKIEPIEALRNE